MPMGVIKWFNNMMKYGFIVSEDDKEIFVHFSEIQMDGYKTLKRGDVVQYDVEETEKGVKAVRVFKLMPDRPSKESQLDAGSFQRSA